MNMIVAFLLIYGGIVDWKKREIPNLVPVALLVVGLGFQTWNSVAIWLLSCVGIWFAMRWLNGDVPGGDFKLICGLLFAIGLVEMVVVLLVAMILAILVGCKPNHHIPLCTYIALAYCLTQLFLLVGGKFL